MPWFEKGILTNSRGEMQYVFIDHLGRIYFDVPFLDNGFEQLISILDINGYDYDSLKKAYISNLKRIAEAERKRILRNLLEEEQN